MRKHFGLALVLTLLFTFGVVSAASAVEDRSFSVSPASLYLTGAAASNSVIVLPKTGNGSFNINFVVPLDHDPGTRILVNVYMASGASCTAATRLSTVTRRRLNSAASVTVTPNVDRVEPAGGVETTTFPATNGILVKKTYIIRTPMAASFTGLQASDGFDIRVYRLPADAADTCAGSVSVPHIEIRYTSVDVAP